jgi:hypothetical protein
VLERFIADAIQQQLFRPLPAAVVIQLLTGALNAAMDLATWQSIDSLEQGASDYFSVFFQGLQVTQQV